jgi:PEP-CTERM motif
MKKLLHMTLALAASLTCSAAFAGGGTITFEAAVPLVLSGGETTIEGNAIVTTVGNQGFDGDIATYASCYIAVCPGGNSTQFYAALNDGGLNVKLAESGFSMTGLDYGFVLPLKGLLDFSVGKLVVTGVNAAGDATTISRDFDLQDALGNFNFSRWDFDSSFATGWFQHVSISSCLYNGNGDCINPASNQAQFAVDNIGYLPEPGSMALVGLSLAGLLAVNRRRRSA